MSSISVLALDSVDSVSLGRSLLNKTWMSMNFHLPQPALVFKLSWASLGEELILLKHGLPNLYSNFWRRWNKAWVCPFLSTDDQWVEQRWTAQVKTRALEVREINSFLIRIMSPDKYLKKSQLGQTSYILERCFFSFTTWKGGLWNWFLAYVSTEMLKLPVVYQRHSSQFFPSPMQIEQNFPWVIHDVLHWITTSSSSTISLPTDLCEGTSYLMHSSDLYLLLWFRP